MLKRKVEASFLDFGPTSTTDSVKSPIPGLSPGLGLQANPWHPLFQGSHYKYAQGGSDPL